VWEARFSAPVQTVPGVIPSLLYNEHRVSFLEVKRPERGVDHTHPYLKQRLKND
jgi:hypothetical protein